MISINISITGVEDVKKTIDKIKSNTSNMQPALVKIGDYLKDTFSSDLYDTQGGIINAFWSPLSSRTLSQKSKKYPGRGILEASGAMRRGYRVWGGTDFLRVFNTQDYAGYHQSGTSKMPARLVMDIQDKQLEFIGKAIGEQLTSGL